jgi:hypothetical protein
MEGRQALFNEKTEDRIQKSEENRRMEEYKTVRREK